MEDLLHVLILEKTKIGCCPKKITWGRVHCQLSQHCKIWDILISQREMSLRALAALHTAQLVQNETIWDSSHVSEASQDILLSSHPIFPLDTQSRSRRTSCERFLRCQPALRLLAYGICSPSSQLGSPSELHLTSSVCTSGSLIEVSLTLGRLEEAHVCLCVLLRPPLCASCCVPSIYCSWWYTMQSPKSHVNPFHIYTDQPQN